MAEPVAGKRSFGVGFQAKCLERTETLSIKDVLQVLDLVFQYVPDTDHRVIRRYKKMNQHMPPIHVKQYTYQGIGRGRFERMEARLKEDILQEAKRYDGTITVIHEIDNGETFDAWENVNDEAFLTLLEVYKRLDSKSLPVKYA